MGDLLDAYEPIDAWDEMFDAAGVLVARGRDYADVTPLKGVYNGPAAHSSDVRVTIRRVV